MIKNGICKGQESMYVYTYIYSSQEMQIKNVLGEQGQIRGCFMRTEPDRTSERHLKDR
jgi:hypothetical protein